jgi:putrescine---pyruvate transaminase
VTAAVPGPFLHPFARPAARPDEFDEIVRGEGARVWDRRGNEYVDALASLWYCNVGHGRAEIADAVAAQMRQLGGYHTFERFTNGPAEELAARLVDLAPMDDARAFLTSSGSEAVDSAIKLARVAHAQAGDHGRTIVVGRRHAYHGVTYGALSAQGLPLNKEGFGPLLGDAAQVEHDDIADAERLFAEVGDRIAVVLAEPVIGAGGIIPPEPGYLEGLRRLCDEHGAFLCLDEVICAFGRLGGWWGADRYGIRPDLVTFAKGVTSGYLPVGGVLVGPAVRAPLEADTSFLLRHGHTYSGHPTSCAAALANLRILEDEPLEERAEAIGERLGPGLADLVDEGLLAGVRGVAGMWAGVLPDGVGAVPVRDRMLELGVIARPLGASAIAFCPPLVISDDDVDRCVEVLRDALLKSH